VSSAQDPGGKVSYQHGNALSLPFSSGTFDVAWTQHVAMNIADRATLYGETFRVLRRGAASPSSTS
jgi:ubiquinone/menaquinone biosynthesis C-methylase UbiE